MLYIDSSTKNNMFVTYYFFARYAYMHHNS
jgi:hypothetical protein